MLKNYANRTAFPSHDEATDGLTKRQLMSAMMLQGLIIANAKEGFVADDLVSEAISCADKLLDELQDYEEHEN